METPATSPAVHNVFVYGSLMADEVVHALLKRVPPPSPALLNNYHRFSIKGRVYPAILPVESKKLTGKVLLGITDPELHVLDEFEDVEYDRRNVEICLFDKTETLFAYTFGKIRMILCMVTGILRATKYSYIGHEHQYTFCSL